MMMDIDFESVLTPFSDPTYTIKLDEKTPILAVHFSPYEWSQDILLVAFEKKIVVGQINLDDKLKFDTLTEIEHDVRCTNLYLSSETATNIVPINVQFCTAASDFKIRVFKTNLGDENLCEELSGHTSYINDLSYDPENLYITSVSDDHTARIWSTSDYAPLATIKLNSPGMSCGFHRDDSSKLLIAEKNGVIRFYNVSAHKPIISCIYTTALSCAHWSPTDCQLIASLHMGELLLWDATRCSRPVENKLVYTEAGGELKFNQSGDFLALTNKLENSVKVLHVQTQQERLNAQVAVPTNITWHFRFPLLCTGDDRKLYFWKISGK